MSTIECDAIVFDVGGTLLDAPDPQARALQRIAHLGDVSHEDFRAGVAQAVADWRQSGGEPSHEDLPETWVRHYECALEAAGFSGDCASAARLLEDTFLDDGWVVFPDVDAVLARLCSEGRTLGVISNWPATLESTLERAGLRRYFAVVVGSGNVGYAKPRSEIYRIAADRLGLHPSRMLYVGDSVEHDFVGARQAGFQTILLDRHGKYPSLSPRIASLENLDVFLQSAPKLAT